MFIGKNSKQRELGFDPLLMLQAFAVTCFYAWFFYRSVLGLVPMLPLGVRQYQYGLQDKRHKQVRKLRLQFQELLLSVETNMRAGYSVENAFREAQRQLEERFGAKDEFVGQIFSICQGLEHNVALEQLLFRFGEESHVEEIQEFGEIFAAAKRSGGRMSEILVSSAQVIGRNIETEEEIQVLLTAKRMEGKMMQVIPFLLVLYLQMTSPDFFLVLYHNATGIIIMTVLALLYAVAGAWSRKILEIKV